MFVTLAGQNFSQKLIATQDPLPNTIVHFLQMITEQKIDAVVKLSKLSDDGKETYDEKNIVHLM